MANSSGQFTAASSDTSILKFQPDCLPYTFPGLNPMVATDAICFMPWIAAEYGLRLAEDYQVRPSCFTGVGDKEDFNKEVCWWVIHKSSFGGRQLYSILFCVGLSLVPSVTLTTRTQLLGRSGTGVECPRRKGLPSMSINALTSGWVIFIMDVYI